MARRITWDIPSVLLEQLDKLVQEGEYNTRAEALKEGVRLLIQKQKARKLREKIKRIKANTREFPSLTKAVVEQHEEDDIS